MLDLYKGSIGLYQLMHEFPYKEALRFRDIRVKRLKAQREEMEAERKKEAAAQAAQNRPKIYVPGQ